MKKLSLILLATAITDLASARVLSVSDSRVFYDVEPKVSVQLIKVDSEISLLTIVGEFGSDELTAAYQEAKALYPHLEPYRVDPTAQGKVRVSVNGFNLEIQPLNSPMGPWFQDQRTISVSEAKKIKQATASDYRISLPVTATYDELKIEEEIKSSSSVCHRLQAQTVKELILELTKLKKPSHVRLDSTFDSYKESLLNVCLTTANNSLVRSFDDLMKLPVAIYPSKNEVLGQTLIRKQVSKSYSLDYKVKELSVGGN